jgi:hypothetical protein
MRKVFDQGRRTYGLPGAEEFSGFEGLSGSGLGPGSEPYEGPDQEPYQEPDQEPYRDQSTGSFPESAVPGGHSRDAAVLRLLHALADEQAGLARLIHQMADEADTSGWGHLRESLAALAKVEDALSRKLRIIHSL